MPKYKSNVVNTNNRYTETFQENLFDKQSWGPKLWEVMHTFSFAYPITPSNIQKQSAMNFFSSIGYLIPCSHCSQHCLEYTRNNPPQVRSKQELVNWVYIFHNEVNKRLGKPIYSKAQLYNKYESSAFCQS